MHDIDRINSKVIQPRAREGKGKDHKLYNNVMKRSPFPSVIDEAKYIKQYEYQVVIHSAYPDLSYTFTLTLRSGTSTAQTQMFIYLYMYICILLTCPMIPMMLMQKPTNSHLPRSLSLSPCQTIKAMIRISG